MDGIAEELANARRTIRQMEAALDSRTDIGIAIGLLMARHSLDRESALKLLFDLSSSTNRKVREVAAELASGAGVSKFEASNGQSWTLRVSDGPETLPGRR